MNSRNMRPGTRAQTALVHRGPQAINLPNDEDLQLTKGSRRLQVKNAMRWVFDQTIVPVADSLIAADQRKHALMMPFMLVPMLLRADQYTGRSGHMAHMRHVV